jgi:molybdopterin molybdotransferase
MRTAELSVALAVAQLAETGTPIVGTETVNVRDALARVLAADVVSALDLPGFDSSAMDGWALRSTDARPGSVLREAGTALAGHPFTGRIGQGECVRIMTGAALPPDADAVVPFEDADRDVNGMCVRQPPQRGANVRPRGEHVRAADAVLRARRHLTHADLGLATAIGCTTLQVRRRLRVGVASTGDELADPPAPLPRAGSYDANRIWLISASRSLGFDATDLGIGVDRTDAFQALLRAAVGAELDALIVSGGAAMGDADIVRQAAGVRFLPVNIRPGRGIAVARIESGRRPLLLLGLPGNSVACFVMFHLIARPALLHVAGGTASIPAHLPLRLASDLRVRGGRIDYRRGRYVHVDGAVAVEPLSEQGSAMLRTVSDADVLIAAGPRDHYRAGDLVDCVPLASL